MIESRQHALDWYPDDAPLDANRFDELETMIERGQQTFVEVGAALLMIRELGLAELRRRGYRTFEDYCQRRWGWSDRHGRRLIDAAEVVADLKTGPMGPVFPTTERQARELVPLKEPEQRAAVWAEAIRTAPDGKPNVADLRRLVQQRQDEIRSDRRSAAPPVQPEPLLPISARVEVADATALPMKCESVDLIVTSPPYGLDVQYTATADYDALLWPEFLQDALQEAWRVTKPGGRLALNIPLDTTKGGYRPTYAQAITVAQDVLWEYRSTIIWNEGNVSRSVARGSVDSPSAPHVIAPVEMVALFSKGDWKRESDREPDLTHDEWLEWTNGLWTFPGESRSWEGHPAAFPEALPRRLIKLLSFPGDTVLDPFLGSGTTLAAALRLGRAGIGFDVSPEYVASARRRLAAINAAEVPA